VILTVPTLEALRRVFGAFVFIILFMNVRISLLRFKQSVLLLIILTDNFLSEQLIATCLAVSLVNMITTNSNDFESETDSTLPLKFKHSENDTNSTSTSTSNLLSTEHLLNPPHSVQLPSPTTQPIVYIYIPQPYPSLTFYGIPQQQQQQQ
jgi:hypothetical protein